MILSVGALQALKKKLRLEEGVKTQLYKCPAGFWSIGIGHNLQARGLPMALVESLFQYDLEQIENELITLWPYYRKLSPARQAACLDIAFNVGAAGFTNFTKMIKAIEAGNWAIASMEMLDSDAARQLPGRYKDNARIMETDKL